MEYIFLKQNNRFLNRLYIQWLLVGRVLAYIALYFIENKRMHDTIYLFFVIYFILFKKF